jgi:uncharacterized protein (DUF58 family)
MTIAGRPTVDPVTAERLRRTRLAVSRRVLGRREGDHASVLLGRGVEPGDARPYVPGDDVRRMDWTVLARTGQPHVRDATAERDLDVVILLDRSASLDFGTARWRKADLTVAVVTAFAELAVGTRDRVGALIAGPEGAVVVPVRGGRSHAAAVVGAAARADIGGSLDLARSLRQLDAAFRRRGLAVIVSDLLGPPDRWVDELRRLGRRHDLVVVEVVDPRELRLPDVGEVRFEDPESGDQRTVDTGDVRLRAAYAAAADQRRAAVAAAVRSAGATHLRLRTDRDWIGPLVACLETRRRDRVAGRRDGRSTGWQR